MLKTGQINTIIMQKNYKCTVCLTDILYILCLKSCYEAVRTGCENFCRNTDQFAFVVDFLSLKTYNQRCVK